MFAIRHAFMILDATDNLTEEETPPTWMWQFDEELSAWFERVRKDRKDRLGGDSGSSSESDDGGMMQNELAVGMR